MTFLEQQPKCQNINPIIAHCSLSTFCLMVMTPVFHVGGPSSISDVELILATYRLKRFFEAEGLNSETTQSGRNKHLARLVFLSMLLTRNVVKNSLSTVTALKQYRPQHNLIIQTQNRIHNNFNDNNGKKITLIWIPSHIGIQGNEVVDQLASQAYNIPISNLPIPHNDLRFWTKKKLKRCGETTKDASSEFAFQHFIKIRNLYATCCNIM
ncbi:hypothetical protein HELRODRAFT_175776 [Helobdella robusta]|uniref:RNase H type-1 domain-containing protein n=1 Tax=Helobdella robusta TaxID=6412 RepID=T1F9N1_HELRO|nr:hypothetical protein HELRODRAFT_175776 [Helobdella robusta]ESO00366.1 hypothetical protein HELRODRAFT_175776 [Helobdella robusta]